MFAQFLWWIVSAMEVLLLFRSIQGKFYSKYPAFYFYLSSVLVLELLRFAVFTLRPGSYSVFYWRTQYFAATVGYAVILEIYIQTFKKYPGAVRVAHALLFGILIAVISRIMSHALSGPVWYPTETMAALERDMRTVQALLLTVIVALLAYYAIPAGRNFQGIITGYGGYVYASVISLAFGAQREYSQQSLWRQIQPLAYLAVLLVWCFTLWSYQPNPEPPEDSRLEHDYRLIAAQTKRLLTTLGSWLKMGSEL